VYAAAIGDLRMQVAAEIHTLQELKRASRWLNDSKKNFYSQTGEDGIIETALQILPNHNKWCIEFGAWDGKHLSNTFHLVENSQYHVVLIEGSAFKYQQLCKEYPYKERATFIHEFVGWSKNDNLDSLLSRIECPSDPDLLSIDIDGNDYHVWKAVENYRPKLVLIEFNPTASNRCQYVQPADPNCNQSSSPAPIVALGEEKGYELICVIGPNLLFVDKKYFNLFNIPDNSLDVLRDEDEVTTLFLGFDGSMIVDGPAEMRWHGYPLKLKQPFPKILQRYPPNYTWLQRKLWGVFRRISK
jgi:hypothetical protein